MDDDIPPLLPFDQMPVVRTQADLYRHWQAMMGPLGFSETLLWMMFFDADGRCTPILQRFQDLPPMPEGHLLQRLMEICRTVLEEMVPGGTVAFLRSRPGPGGLTAADRRWANRLGEVAGSSGVACHPVHLANNDELRVFTPDDQIRSSTAS